MENQKVIFEKPVEDYLRIATDSTRVEIANPRANAQHITEAYDRAWEEQAELLVLQELGVTGYSVADTVFNRRVLEESREVVDELANHTAFGPAMVVGAPIQDRGVH